MPLALVGAAFVVVMLGTTLPTPLYPLLGEKFGFGELSTTVIFATYPVGVTTALLLFGGWSDQLGRRPLLLAGLALSALSAGAFLLAESSGSLSWIFVGRVFSGLSAGIFTGTATATIVDLAPEGHGEHAGLVAAAVNMGGLGLGPLVAGLLADFAPSPLRLPYWVDLGLVLLAAVAILAVPEPVRRSSPPDLRPQSVGVPDAVRPVFVRAALAGFAGFAVLGLFGAVSPAFLGTVIGRSSTALTGVVVLGLFAASVVGQVLALRLGLDRALRSGCIGLVVGMVILGASLALGSLPVLVLGGIVAGLGQGLSFRAGLGAVTSASPPEMRGRIASAYFVFLYVGIALPVVGEGVAATAFGLVTAGLLFSALVGVLALVALVLLRRSEPV